MFCDSRFPHIKEIGHFLQNTFDRENGLYCKACNEKAKNGGIDHRKECKHISEKYHRQKGRLSFCSRLDPMSSIWLFEKHEDCLFDARKNKKNILKFDIYKSERDKVLGELKEQGISYHWLTCEEKIKEAIDFKD